MGAELGTMIGLEMGVMMGAAMEMAEGEEARRGEGGEDGADKAGSEQNGVKKKIIQEQPARVLIPEYRCWVMACGRYFASSEMLVDHYAGVHEEMGAKVQED